MTNLKTPEEIAILREGGKRHAVIFKEILPLIKPGISTLDIENAIMAAIKKGGDEAAFLNYTPYGADRPFPAATCVSINEEVVHGIPNEDPKVLKEGDIVSVDFGLRHKKLYTDSAVTVAVGAIDPVSTNLLEATRKALYAGIMAAKGGNRIGDIGNAIQKVAEKAGFSLADDLSGHGVGREIHEDPYVPNWGDKGKGMLLKPGMVLAIEPMLNVGTSAVILKEDGYTYRTADMKRSAHFEHTILITTGDAEILTEL